MKSFFTFQRFFYATVLLVLVPVSGQAGTNQVVTWGRVMIPKEIYTDRFSQIACGAEHNLALKADGTVIAWGKNDKGQAVVPAGLTGVVQVSAGYAHSLALKSDGKVVAWGFNEDGQATVPSGLSGVVQVSAGFNFNLALKSDGTVAAWGRNDVGQCTVPGGLNNVVQVGAAIGRSFALKADGTIVTWGSTSPWGLSDVVQIAIGSYHSLALKSDGTVASWGGNSYGEGVVPAGLSGVVGLAVGERQSLALKSDGTVVAWGQNAQVPAGLSGVVQIAAGPWQVLALKSDGTVMAWGDTAFGGNMMPDHVTQIVGNLAVKSDGTVVTWGDFFGAEIAEVPGLSDVVHISLGTDHDLALKSNGTVFAWGGNSFGESTVPSGLSSVVQVFAGFHNSLALKSDGTVVAWGKNNYGQSTVPSGLSDVVQIAMGGDYNLALKSDGTVVAWGSNAYGRGTVPDGLSDVVQVGINGIQNMALKSDGTVVVWGDGEYFGLVDIPPDLSGVVRLAVGGSHVLALKSDGTVVAWGNNYYGQATVPDGLSDVVLIFAGSTSSLALKANGEMVAWGTDGDTSISLLDPDQVIQITDVAYAGHSALITVPSYLPTAAPGVLINPARTVAKAGGSVRFRAYGDAKTQVAYQWQQSTDGEEWEDVDGADSPILTVSDLTWEDNGTLFRARITNGEGTACTSGGRLVLIKTPSVIGGEGSASGKVGVSFTYQIVANGDPVSYSASGLPEGLVLDTATGAISGTPTEYGEIHVTIGATNSGGGIGTRQVIFDIDPLQPVITNGGTASGQVGVSMSYKIEATNSPTSYAAVSLPEGLSVNVSTGKITGRPKAPGTVQVTLKASNVSGTGSKKVIFTILPMAPVISSPDTVSLEVGLPMTYQIVASNNPTSYSATNLPGGLSINASTGKITGTPGGWLYVNPVTISATNAGGTGTQIMKFSVSFPEPPVITSGTSKTGQVGLIMSYQIVADNKPTSYAASGLPPGLKLNAGTGKISGTPTKAGTFTASVEAINRVGSDGKTVKFTILQETTNPVITITTPSTLKATVGTLSYTVEGKVTDNINALKVQYRIAPISSQFGSFKAVWLSSKVATTKIWSCQLAVSSKGVYKVEFRPVDAAGNIGKSKIVTITRQ